MADALDWVRLSRAWQAAWREVATFLDRIGSAADQDASVREGQHLLTEVALLTEELQREAAPYNRRLGPPPELAASWPVRQGQRATVTTVNDRANVLDLSKVLPGDWDVEAAVRAISFGNLPESDLLDPDILGTHPLVRIRAAGKLLTLVSVKEDRSGLEEVEVKLPGNQPATPSNSTFYLDVDQGYFSRMQRRVAANESRWAFTTCGLGGDTAGITDEEEPAIHPFTSLAKARRDALPEVDSTTVDGGVTADELKTLRTSFTLGTLESGAVQGVVARAQATIAALGTLSTRVSSLVSGLEAVEGESWAIGARVGTLRDEVEAIGGHLSAMNEAYSTIGQSLSALPLTMARFDQAVGAAERLSTTRAAMKVTTLQNRAESGLDNIVDTRIGYPDGTLRQLRLLETTFVTQWAFRRGWFGRYRPWLATAFGKVLLAYAGVVKAMREGKALATIGVNLLPASEVAAVNARRLSLAEAPADPGLVQPGAALILRGEREALAILTGAEVSPDRSAKLRLLPLRVSLVPSTAKAPVPGSPGIVSAAPTFSSGPSRTTDTDLRRGRDAAHPERDGVIEQVVNLWSILCLILGTSTAEGSLGGAFPAALPSTGWVKADLRVAGDALRILIPEASLSGTSWWDTLDPRRSVLARPGELLLVRGKDPKGMWWQSVGEARRVMVLSRAKAETAPGTATPEAPVCCGGSGDTIVVEVDGLRFPEPLVEGTVRVGREFQGFGAESLAARELLPREIDPANTNGPMQQTKRVNRTPEFEYALKLLDRLFGLSP